MKKVYGLLLILTCWSSGLHAQNTERLKVMTYNLLNYRNTTPWCDGSNNSSSQKDTYLKTIVDHVAPHIMVCQEVGAQSGVPSDRILTNCLNTGGTTYWNKVAYTNNGFSDLVNAAFYDTRHVGLKSQSHISVDANNQSLVRVIDFYRFYYKDSLLSADPDTVFFTLVAAHLKAGSTTSDANQRTQAALAVMQYIQTEVEDDNVILCGDLNMNSGSDAAFQHLINYTVAGVRLYDPMNETGTWYNNYGSRYIHTQSTRSSNTNSGCFSGGGMDDRYDHILISDEVLNGAEGIEIVNNSFTVVGNDGLHFNAALTDGTNLSVPSDVLNALYGMSDHLPVTIEIDIETKSIGVTENYVKTIPIRVAQLNEKTIRIEWPYNAGDAKQLEISDAFGRIVYSDSPAGHSHLIELTSTGVYVVRVLMQTGEYTHAKFLLY